jgi:cyanophycinase
MLPLFVLAAALAAVPPAAVPPATPAPPAGHLVLIGGGEIESPEAIHKIVDLAGGPASPIVVIPTASEESDAAEYYTNIFTTGAGCTNVTALDIKKQADAARADYVALVAKARAIFFGGGDQVRITNALLDTPVGNAIVEAFRRGAIVGGTSAGTACQSALMITGVGDFRVIRGGAVELKRGFGLFRGVIVDQHFIQRQRSNRLLAVILEHPDLLGVGVDEDTAVWVRPDGTFDVLGSASVIVIDPKGSTVSRAPAENDKDLLGVHDLRVHVLLPGEGYDPQRHVVTGAPRRK